MKWETQFDMSRRRQSPPGPQVELCEIDKGGPGDHCLNRENCQQGLIWTLTGPRKIIFTGALANIVLLQIYLQIKFSYLK